MASVDLPTQMVWILAAYIVLGVICAWRLLRDWFFLFGAKTFGALSLTVALAVSDNLGWTNYLARALNMFEFATAQYIVSWVILTAIVQVAGHLLFPIYVAHQR